MKIGILTFHYANNFGALLQAYALKIKIEELGHQSVIIDRQPESSFKYSFKGKIYGFVRNRKFKKFRNSHLSPLTEAYLTNEEMKTIMKQNFDAIIVGSDQVWRYEQTEVGYNYFLDFIRGNKTKKIAYAASFGKDTWNQNQETTRRIKELLQNFDAVSVREKSAVKICDDIFSIPARQVLDPTLLLPPETYGKFIKRKINRNSLVTYILDPSSEKNNLIKDIKEKLDLRLFNLLPLNDDKLYSMLQMPSVNKWLEKIANADFVITDSFHGTVFSILFNRQFVAIANEKRGNTRFLSLLNLFGLTRRLINSSAEANPALLKEPIDYERTNRLLTNYRQSSVSFLSDALNKE